MIDRQSIEDAMRLLNGHRVVAQIAQQQRSPESGGSTTLPRAQREAIRKPSYGMKPTDLANGPADGDRSQR